MAYLAPERLDELLTGHLPNVTAVDCVGYPSQPSPPHRRMCVPCDEPFLSR